jgi:hypothetical protein
LVGCERCLKDLGCELSEKGNRLQAFYECPHGLVAFSERSEDCFCQLTLLQSHLRQATVLDATTPAPPRILTSDNIASSSVDIGDP